MGKRLTSVVVTGAIALGGVGAGLVAVPVIAAAATTDATDEATSDGTVPDAVGDRLSRLRDALSGLVSDGTIDEAQADAVAEALDEALPQRGPGGHGGPGGPEGLAPGGGSALEEAAGLLGLTAGELLARRQAGESLAGVAGTEGVEVATLVDGLVAVAEEHVAEHVEAGDLTQAEADERLADAQERITTLVEREGLPLRGGHGMRGAPDPSTEDATDDATDEATVGTTGLTA